MCYYGWMRVCGPLGTAQTLKKNQTLRNDINKTVLKTLSGLITFVYFSSVDLKSSCELSFMTFLIFYSSFWMLMLIFEVCMWVYNVSHIESPLVILCLFLADMVAFFNFKFFKDVMSSGPSDSFALWTENKVFVLICCVHTNNHIKKTCGHKNAQFVSLLLMCDVFVIICCTLIYWNKMKSQINIKVRIPNFLMKFVW